MVVICGVVGVLVGFCLGSQVGRCGSGHVCYLLCGWRFGGLFCRILNGGSWRFSGFSYRKLSWKVWGLNMFVICFVVGVLVGFSTGYWLILAK